MSSHNVFPATFFFFFFCSFIILISTFSEAQLVPAVFVFGDSLVDVGNNNFLKLSLAKANFPHNGVDFPTTKPTGRFCNGKNAADFLADKVGLPTSPPYLSVKNNASTFQTGVSFASGGAGIFDGTDQLYRQSLTLTKQVEYYISTHGELVQKLGSSAAQQHLSKSLFAIVIGSNDIFGYAGSSDPQNKSTPEQFANLMTSTLKGHFKQLYTYGARKFLVVGVGAIGCCPSERIKNKTEECSEQTNYMSIKYNEGLKSMLIELKSELKDINYSYFDTFGVLMNFIRDPATYGFGEVKAACCGLGNLNAKVPCTPISKYCSNRRAHVFWDLYHPTEAAARIFVDTIFDGSLQYTFPMNLRQLIAV